MKIDPQQIELRKGDTLSLTGALWLRLGGRLIQQEDGRWTCPAGHLCFPVAENLPPDARLVFHQADTVHSLLRVEADFEVPSNPLYPQEPSK